ncbi:LapA family protein [Sedimentibacter sp. MB31-C6]|uniref:LapA family protein n=1 Tax=Sedimentibacter sp. MB31-C6 TaxID=3109366 RepID=UPI002DDDBC5E|nr:LapA family protein [Sedimentibacter sp. MB36-C1]WSI04477.1 LapA family protein [Sedimentibacter sp. MB36-C1]
MQVGFIIILIIAIFVAIFAIQNGTPVEVDLFLAQYDIPLAVIIMVCLILGAIIVLLLGTYRQFRKCSEVKELKNKIKVLENDKILFENNIKTMESDILTLRESNNELETKALKLEETNNVHVETIKKLNDKLQNANEETDNKDEGIDLSNEKSEVESE